LKCNNVLYVYSLYLDVLMHITNNKHIESLIFH